MSWVTAELPHGRLGIINTEEVTEGLENKVLRGDKLVEVKPYISNELIYTLLSFLSDEDLNKYNTTVFGDALDKKQKKKVVEQLSRHYRIIRAQDLNMKVSQLKEYIRANHGNIIIDFISDQAHVHGKVDVDELLEDKTAVGVIGEVCDINRLELDLNLHQVRDGFRYLFDENVYRKV